MPLPTRAEAQLFSRTVDLTSGGNLQPWKDMVDQGIRIDQPLRFVNPRFQNKEQSFSAIEVMCTCWPLPQLAQAIVHAPQLFQNDAFFENIARPFEEINLFYPCSGLQEPFELWYGQSKKALFENQDADRYGCWGIWETLMFRNTTLSVTELAQVVNALQLLPKITEVETLDMMYNVVTLPTSKGMPTSGILALRVGVNSALYNTPVYKKLHALAVVQPHNNVVEEALALAQRDTISNAVGAHSKKKSNRKI